MNIAFLTSEYPHPKVLNSAGIGTSIKNLATELSKLNYNVTIFVYSQDINEIFEDSNIKIHKIARKKYKLLGWYLYRKHLQNYINTFIERDQIQLVEAPDWTGITAFIKLKCPLLIKLHGTDAYFCHLEGRKQKFKNFVFEKLALKSADAIVSVSNFAACQTKEIFKLKSDIKVIPNGIDLGKFNNNNSELFEPNTLLYFGTIIRKKGIIELAYIFNELVKLNNDVKLILIGDDSKDILTGSNSTLSLMKDILSVKAKPKVLYLRKVSYEMLADYIKNVQICVFPSLAETFGMVTIEAMAMQKVVITSNFGWNKDIIDDGVNGYLRNPKNHHEFAMTIHEIMMNNSLVLKIGKEAELKVRKNFDIKKIVRQDISIYQSIIER
jgi:glycosyltransferase involved in cell wall biosynthesis